MRREFRHSQRLRDLRGAHQILREGIRIRLNALAIELLGDHERTERARIRRILDLRAKVRQQRVPFRVLFGVAALFRVVFLRGDGKL